MDHKQKSPAIKVIFCGEVSAQLPLLITAIAYPDQDLDGYIPSCYDDPITINWRTPGDDGEDYELVIVMTRDAGACEPRLRQLLYYPHTDVFLICFSLDDESALETLNNLWIPEIEYHGRDVPYIIVGTRSESKQVFYKEPISEIITRLIEERKASSAHAYTYLEVSARRGLGLDELLKAACLAGDQHRKVRLAKTRRKKRCQIL